MIFSGAIATAQNLNPNPFTINVWGNGYVGVHNYSGVEATNALVLQISFNGTPVINLPNWKVSVRVKQPIKDTEGVKVFPPEKLVLHPNSTSGNQTPYGMPSPQQIGMPNDVPLSLSEVFVVPQSATALYNDDTSFESYLYFDLQILPGAYLGDLQGGYTQRSYPFGLEVIFYSQNNQILGKWDYNYKVDVYKLSGTPPVQNSFSLTVNGGAQNGTLTLQSRSDYENGASVTYNNGLTVKTNAAYQVTVNASPGTPHFSYQNNTIDLDVLNVKLATTTPGVTNLNTVTLSTGQQVIAKGQTTNNNNVNFDVGYSINLAQKDKLLYAYKDKQQSETSYTTTLQYTIMAQ